MNAGPLFDEAGLRDAVLPAERRLMEMHLGAHTARLVLDLNMVGEVDSPLGEEMHRALHHPERSYRQGFAEMAVVAAGPPAWGVLARWAKGRATRVRQGSTQGEKADARTLSRLARRISAELERLCAHPAYHGQAVVGIEPLILPAYRVKMVDTTPDGDLTSFGPPRPTPDEAVKAVDWLPGEIEVGEMLPYALTSGSRAMTTWIWSQVPAPTPHGE